MGYENFYATRLFTDIGAADDTITLEQAPAETSGRLTLEARNPTKREIISYTGVSGNDITGVSRGQGGTAATTHIKGALVEMNVTAEDLDDALGVPEDIETRFNEIVGDHVASGMVWTDDTGLNADMSAGVVYINGLRLSVGAVSNHAFTASKDTYIDIGDNGTLDYNEVANGAAAPALAASHIRLARVVTSGTDTTSVANYNNPAYLERQDGWQNPGDAWAYSAWDSTNKTGTITIPAGGASKYSTGMKGSLYQATGGTKYFFITEVNDTTIKGYFGTDYTLNNETISSPYYSTQKAPFGFPLNPAKWTITTTSANDRSTTSTSYASLTDNIVLPIGAWNVELDVTHQHINGTAGTRASHITLSTDGSTETNPAMTSSIRTTAALNISYHDSTRDRIIVTTATTCTMMGKVNNATTMTLGTLGATMQPTRIRAVSAYL